MIKVIASIRLYKNGRKTPFKTRYRPWFNFIEELMTSGQITLHDRVNFRPGEEGIVEIAYLHKEFLGEEFGEGTRFTFGEGPNTFGDGIIQKILIFEPEPLKKIWYNKI